MGQGLLTSVLARPCVPGVLLQHAEEAAIQHGVRRALVGAAHVKLLQLQRLDERIAAHLDGLYEAGDEAWRLCEESFASPGAGEVFTATVHAIEARNPARLDRVLALTEALSELHRGVADAFGWLSATSLRGVVPMLLASPSAFRRRLGIEACGAHRVDPGAPLLAALQDADAPLRASALRVAGECARHDLRRACVEALADEDETCRFQASVSAMFLGERQAAASALYALASRPSEHRGQALACWLLLADIEPARAMLKALSDEGNDKRLLIRAVGIAGDAHFVPWLLQQMQDGPHVRIAGESFSLITGLDLAWNNLEIKPPEDTAEDDDIAADEDYGLPWPDASKLGEWWRANAMRFPPGRRFFMGETPSAGHAGNVLRQGTQRQRIAAARWRCLLEPGTPLFNASAPAWRQQRWLGAAPH